MARDARRYSSGLPWRIQLRPSRRPIVIASRRSQLARVQAESIGAALARLHPRVVIDYLWIESEGDQFAEVSLADSGGKGLFAKAIEKALLDGKADLAVHSLKDVPTKLTKGLTIAAIPPREDPRDCLVTRSGVATIHELSRGAVLGTASPRRAAQALRLRPDLKIELIRGNVQTRLRKVLEPIDATTGGKHYDATFMAVAGLKRAGLAEHAKNILDPAVLLPAAGQGALALQCRGDDHVTTLRVLPLNDSVTAQAVALERDVIDGLQGDCHSPIAALAEPVMIESILGYRLRARVFSSDGQLMAEADEQAAGKALRKLSRRVLEKLNDAGCAGMMRK